MTDTSISFDSLAEFSSSHITVVIIPAAFTSHTLFSFQRRSNHNLFCPVVKIGSFLMTLSEDVFLFAISLKYKSPHISPAEISYEATSQLLNVLANFAFQAVGCFILLLEEKLMFVNRKTTIGRLIESYRLIVLQWPERTKLFRYIFRFPFSSWTFYSLTGVVFADTCDFFKSLFVSLIFEKN